MPDAPPPGPTSAGAVGAAGYLPCVSENEEHPARAAAQRSVAAVMAGDKDTWLANFAEGALVQDPIGPSFFDPEGHGHRGTEAISAFWDQAIGPNQIDFVVRESYACGDECGNVVTITTTLPGGDRVVVQGIATYKVDAEGRLLHLRAFWEQENASYLPAGSDSGAGS